MTNEGVRKAMNISDSALQRCVSDYSFGKFQIKRGEVCIRWDNKKNKTNKNLRAIFLTHRPTGVQMAGYLRPKSFNPTKKEMSELRQQFITLNLQLFEYAVRRYLRACMSRQFGPIPAGQFND